MTMLEAMFIGMGMVLVYGVVALLLALRSHRPPMTADTTMPDKHPW